MCGTLDFFPDPTEVADSAMQAIEKAHPNCSGTAVGVIVTEGKVTVTTTIPLTDLKGGSVFWPLSVQASKALVASKPLSCVANALEVFTDPVVSYPAPDPHAPIYRGLGCEEEPMPKIELPPARCVKNEDSSTSFILEVAPFVKTDEEIAAQGIERCVYVNELGRQALASYEEGLRGCGISTWQMFEMDEHGQITPEAVVLFYDQLLPTLRVGENVVIGVPNKGAESQLYTFTFEFPSMPKTLPLMGLVHDIDPSVGEVAEVVEGDYFVYSNTPLELTVRSEAGADTRISLWEGEEYVKAFGDGPITLSEGVAGYASRELQQLGAGKVNAAMASAVGKEVQGELHAANLFGRALPNTATGATVTVLDSPRVMHARKRVKV